MIINKKIKKIAKNLRRDAFVAVMSALILAPIVTMIFIACADNDEDSDYCIISFDANRGRGSMKSIRTLAGKAIIIPEVAFEREGWEFKEWEAIEQGEKEPSDTYSDRDILRTEVSLTLRAVWKEKSNE